jgi:tetratricopeptide (TPR) repeat protein
MAADGVNLEDQGWGEGSRFAAHLDRGWSLLDKGDLSAARTSAEEARQIRPEDPDAPLLLGAIALADDNPAESVEWYERAIELDPEYVEPYAAAASVCLVDLGQAERAVQLCDRAIDLEHLHPLEVLDLQLLAAEAELSLGLDPSARARLGGLGEPQVLLAALSAPPLADDQDPRPLDEVESPIDAAAIAHLYYDREGEALDPEERVQQLARTLGYGLRLSRVWLDLGAIEEAREMLRTAVDRFPGDADAWHLLSEAEYLAADTAMATQAAVRTLRLDRQAPEPATLPSAALLHARVVEVLTASPVQALRDLVERPVAFSILVQAAVPEELVLEGMDPRLAVLALTVRGGPGGGTQPPFFLSGVALYRRGLVRLGPTQQTIDEQLVHLLHEELALSLELPDSDRVALGLHPINDPTEGTD